MTLGNTKLFRARKRGNTFEQKGINSKVMAIKNEDMTGKEMVICDQIAGEEVRGGAESLHHQLTDDSFLHTILFPLLCKSERVVE
jgi:hypothetical protein